MSSKIKLQRDPMWPMERAEQEYMTRGAPMSKNSGLFPEGMQMAA